MAKTNEKKDCKTKSNDNRKFNKSKRYNGRNTDANSKRSVNSASDAMQSTLQGTNDVSWYAYSDAALNSAAQLYFPTPSGLPVTCATTGQSYITPGVMAIDYTPAFGVSEEGDASSPMNVAKQSLYAFVRHANSGSKNYEGADLFMYMLALDSLYALYYEARRVYSISTLYTRTNRYYPKAIIEAMGWDPDDVIANAANFRSYLNNIAYALGSFAIPKGMTIFDRRRYLASNVFLDDTGDKAQSYVFRINAFWKWEGFEDEEGTQLKLCDVAHALGTYKAGFMGRANGYALTVDTFYQGFMNIVNAYLADEDVGVMSGDIKKAFGDNLHVISGTPLDNLTLPVFDEEMAAQINNAVAVGFANSYQTDSAVVNETPALIAQRNGLLYIENALTKVATTRSTTDYAFNVCECAGGFLNIRRDSPTPADIMIATRLTNVVPKYVDSTSAINTAVPLKTCGSEVVNTFTIFSGPYGTTNFAREATVFLSSTFISPAADETELNYLAKMASVLTKFQWHPMIYVHSISATGVVNSTGVCKLIGDIYNMTGFDDAWLTNLNRTALYSMLTTTALGTFNPNANVK